MPAGLAACCVLVLALVAGPGRAQDRNLRFDRISLEHGLSQGTVNTIHQDSLGFMWFGTEDGLNLYDGYEFTVYKHDRHDPGSLAHNFIWDVHEDRRGVIWVATDGGGLSRWYRAEDRFSTLRHDDDDPSSLGNDRVRVILEDREGQIWIGTDGGGLDRMRPAGKSFDNFRHDPDDPTSLSSNRIRALHEDRDGNLWIGTFGGGLSRMDRGTGTFETFRHDPNDVASLSGDRIRTIQQAPDGTIWVGTYQGGVSRLDPEKNTFTRYGSTGDGSHELGRGRVRALLADRSGQIWIGTGDGLCHWRQETDDFDCYRHSSHDGMSLSNNRVSSIFPDRGGVLWVGTKGGGLNKWNTTTGHFLHYRADASSPLELTGNAVTSFQERDGVIWAGTFGAGLNRLNRASESIETYRHDPDDPGSLGDDQVMALRLDRHGGLWVGTFEGGLNQLDPTTGKFTRFLHDPNDENSLSRNGVMAIHEDPDGMLWIGTFEGGLNRLDPTTGKFSRYLNDADDLRSLSNNRVTSFCETDDGELWIGTDGGGLNRYDPITGHFEQYRAEPDRPDGLASDAIWSLHQDASGTLWIGTQGSGLHGWSAKDRKARRAVFTVYTERDGMPNNHVYGILSDDEGHLWVSTNQGLARFDPKAKTFTSFYQSHGLQSNEFNFGAYQRTSEGELLFGGINGFNAFFPDRIQPNSYSPPVVLTSFMKFNEEFELEQPIYKVGAVTLDYTDYVVSFEFAAMDYTASDKNRYAYMLEGFDSDWIDLGPIRRATYTNLDAGRYTLRVKAANADGTWNEVGTALGVRVLAPPWKTWWAYTAYTLFGIAVLLSIVRLVMLRAARQRQYQEQLELEVAERTQQLNVRNDELQEANGKLEEASMTDSLTGLRNRRYLMTQIDKDIALLERYYRQGGGDRTPNELDFQFLMIDLDGLKFFNDTYGHMAGDAALCEMRSILLEVCRKSDTVIRWGGDEFLVVGRSLDLAAAEALAERIRSRVSAHRFKLSTGVELALSCSVGYAQYPFLPAAPATIQWQQVLTIADRALYVAKTSGKNAWVALFGTDRTQADNLVHRINDETETLLQEGALTVRTSIDDPERLVWNRS